MITHIVRCFSLSLLSLYLVHNIVNIVKRGPDSGAGDHRFFRRFLRFLNVAVPPTPPLLVPLPLKPPSPPNPPPPDSATGGFATVSLNPAYEPFPLATWLLLDCCDGRDTAFAAPGSAGAAPLVIGIAAVVARVISAAGTASAFPTMPPPSRSLPAPLRERTGIAVGPAYPDFCEGAVAGSGAGTGTVSGGGGKNSGGISESDLENATFRDAEVVPEFTRVLEDGEVVSEDGTHLGHNLPDANGTRYCINLVSVAGYERADERGLSGTTQ